LIRLPFTGKHFQPELFWSWKAWDKQRNQILTNVVMFIPIGILAGRLLNWKGLWIAFGLSMTVEVLQLVTSRGLMEFDDVIHNMIGAAIGIGIVMATEHVRNKNMTKCEKQFVQLLRTVISGDEPPENIDWAEVWNLARRPVSFVYRLGDASYSGLEKA